jgi:hypothetical protein
MDLVTQIVVGVVVVLIFGAAIFAAAFTIRDEMRKGRDWRVALLFWIFIFVIMLLIFLMGYDAITDES